MHGSTKGSATLLGVLAWSLSAACGDGETGSARVSLEITAEGAGDGYRLEVPESFLLHRDSRGALLRAAYPGMHPYSPDIRERFYDEKRLWAQDFVLIDIDVQRPFEGEELEFADRNDPGRFIFENHIRRRLEPSASPEPFLPSDPVTKYVGSQEHETLYVLRQEDGRLAVVKCSYETRCKARTTWKGAFSVTYLFGRSHFQEVLDLDRSVFRLISSFSPQPVEEDAGLASVDRAASKPL